MITKTSNKLNTVSSSDGSYNMRDLDVLGLIVKLFSLLFVVLLPIRPALIAVSALVIADFITGLWASKKEGKPITSSGLRRTVVKGLAYQSAIIVAFVLETYLLDGLPVIKAVTALIGITEAKSFFENVKRITGIDFWSHILSKLNMPDIKTKKEGEEK